MPYSLLLSIYFLLLCPLANNTVAPKKSKISKGNLEKRILSPSNTSLMAISVYKNLRADPFELPNFESFEMALKGYMVLKEKGIAKKEILTLIDFSLSANSKRLWVIDLAKNVILFHSLVAHGKNTGEEYASHFSNRDSSFQSSLGFYSTGEIYSGKHGLSLKLDGLESGINSNARKRAIVLHGAAYVSDEFIQQNKRLGRSLGCPALPNNLNRAIITAIKEQSILFIYHPSRKKRDNNALFAS